MTRLIQTIKKIQDEHLIFFEIKNKNEANAFFYNLNFHASDIEEKKIILRNIFSNWKILLKDKDILVVRNKDISFKFIKPNKNIVFNCKKNREENIYT